MRQTLRSICCVLTVLSILLCLISCGGAETKPQGIEATVCNGHYHYSHTANEGIIYHRCIATLDGVNDAISHLKSIGKSTTAVGIKESTEDMAAFYSITATGANNEADDIEGFLQDGITRASIQTYVILKNRHCDDKLESDDGIIDHEHCSLRFIDFCIPEIKNSGQYDKLVEMAGCEDFALLRIEVTPGCQIEDTALLSFELVGDSSSYYTYRVYYCGDRVFSLQSCVLLDDEIISAICENIVLMD